MNIQEASKEDTAVASPVRLPLLQKNQTSAILEESADEAAMFARDHAEYK